MSTETYYTWLLIDQNPGWDSVDTVTVTACDEAACRLLLEQMAKDIKEIDFMMDLDLDSKWEFRKIGFALPGAVTERLHYTLQRG